MEETKNAIATQAKAAIPPIAGNQTATNHILPKASKADSPTGKRKNGGTGDTGRKSKVVGMPNKLSS